jgi:sugar lactone lactonase YvrE
MTITAILVAWSTGVSASEIEVIVREASFPEGPLWHGGQLYYVEYGADTVRTWDGKENTTSLAAGRLRAVRGGRGGRRQRPGDLLRRQHPGQDQRQHRAGRGQPGAGRRSRRRAGANPQRASPFVTNLTFGETEDVVFVTAATDAWSEPCPGQVYRLENR